MQQAFIKRLIPLVKRRAATCQTCTAGYSTQPRASTSSNPSQVHAPPAETVQSHLDSLLHPLPPLPASLALRLSTHKSFPDLRGNHNARLAFLGRRHLRAFLAMFLIQHASSLPDQVIKPAVIDEALDLRSALGRRVGDTLELEKSMRWTQIMGQKGNSFWTIRGLGVESLIGGMNGFYGTAKTQQFFHARILPRLQLQPELRSAIDSTSAKAKQQLGILPDSSSQAPSEELLVNLGKDTAAEASL